MNKLENFHDELNFRELGGYETVEHTHIKHGLFYRGACLGWFSQKERKAFQKLGIRYVLDLRTRDEAAKMPDPVMTDVENIRHSGVVSKGGEEIDFSPKGMSQTGLDGRQQYEKLMKYYENMPFHNEAFRVLFQQIREGKLPVYFHCATGKDRTGVAAMLILLLLGADEKTILYDYMLTNDYRKDEIQRIFQANQKQTEDPYGEKLLMMRAGVLEETGQNVLQFIKNKCGTYEKYFDTEYGYTIEDIADFRKKYTE